MAQNDRKSTTTIDPADDVFGGMDVGEQGVRQGMAPMILPSAQGDTAMNIFNGVITAQRVAVKRDEAAIMQKIKILAAANAKRWVYGWSVNDKSSPTGKSWIEGPTIKLTNAVARIWGNCLVDTRIVDEGSNWVFYSKFVDFETGSALVRSYQQRKNQNIGGKMDAGRANDLVFQIGQSKSQRNVVKNVLEDIVDFAMDCAKAGVLERIKANPAEARKWCLTHIEGLGVDIKLVEHARGRKMENWTDADVAKVYAEISAIEEGSINAADVWPSPETAKEQDPASDVFGDVNKTNAKQEQQPAQQQTTKSPSPDTSPNPPREGGGEAQIDAAAAGAVKKEEQQTQGRALVLDGGDPLGRTLQEFELGEVIKQGGKQYKVLSFNDKEIVVQPVKAAAAPKADTKPAQQQPAAKPAGKNKLFDD